MTSVAFLFFIFFSIPLKRVVINLEWVTGIEPVRLGRKHNILPLNYTHEYNKSITLKA